jgi:hypothetical protein
MNNDDYEYFTESISEAATTILLTFVLSIATIGFVIGIGMR